MMMDDEDRDREGRHNPDQRGVLSLLWLREPEISPLAWTTRQPVAIAGRPPPRQPSRTFRRTMSRSAKIPIQKFDVLASSGYSRG
jgi:hypothetical protein